MNSKDPILFDNVKNKVIDDLRENIKENSSINIVAASFSIYAYKILKEELDKIKEFNFIFSNKVFTKEIIPKEAREFYIPRLNTERSLYGTPFEIKLKNELTQQLIAKESAEWIKRKVKFKANISDNSMSSFMTIENNDEVVAFNPFNNFTTSDLGVEKSNNAYYTTTKLYAETANNLLESFKYIWNDKDKLKDVTENVLENITAAYKENGAEFIYYLALYNIFKEFLEDINADFLPNEATGFKQSKIWEKLYSFQKDAVIGCITKLNKHDGCILADSVGLGKTFSALGVIKYYESRNKNVLVLCPKRLEANWNTYKNNYKNNPLANDKFRYDVLFHTDLDREKGKSNGLDLQSINWGNYDLVVIDESHNFRNGESTTHAHDDEEDYQNRYQKLVNKILKEGVKTKVLMLSATPVNTSFTDLKNQLILASEGDTNNFGKNLNTENNIDIIFRETNKAFSDWSKLSINERTTERLLDMLKYDFFSLLDSVTIARSRKNIEKYFKEEKLGTFPNRLKPASYSPELTNTQDLSFNTIFYIIDKLNLEIYNPLKFVFPSKIGKYIDLNSLGGGSWQNREKGRNILMITNLLKRLESSIYAFRLTIERLQNSIQNTIQKIDEFENKENINQLELGESLEDLEEGIQIGDKLKIDLVDIDRISFREKIEEDKKVIDELLTLITPITQKEDLKLQTLLKVIKDKVNNPLNKNNKKILIFTAFADTAEYLYQELSGILKTELNINSALVTGGGYPKSTLELNKSLDFNEVLTFFSPISKERDLLYKDSQENIDILFATDCISEGQNLQDCDYLINYDIHWNPVRIIQRFGRIDRIGSLNEKIQLVNFWPNISLDDYINLKARVENRMKIIDITTTGNNNPISTEDNPELEYRKKQLEKITEGEVDLENIDNGVSIMDLGLNEFHLDLQELLKVYGDAETSPHGIHATVKSKDDLEKGVIFVLKNINSEVNINKQNRLHPFYLAYIKDNGEIFVNYLNPKSILDKFRLLAKGENTPNKDLVNIFNQETKNGKNMDKYTELLTKTIQSIIDIKEETGINSIFKAGGTELLKDKINGLDDFELINFLIIK